MRVGRIDSSEQSVMNPPPADHVEKSIVNFSLIKHAKSLINSFIN
jgi:hypothetical protein